MVWIILGIILLLTLSERKFIKQIRWLRMCVPNAIIKRFHT